MGDINMNIPEKFKPFLIEENFDKLTKDDQVKLILDVNGEIIKEMTKIILDLDKRIKKIEELI